MNNIYKVIWSKAKNCYVVVSEIARSHTKSASGSEKIGGVTRRSLLASLMALSLLCGGLGVAEAAVVHVNEDVGGTSAVYTTDETYTKTQADDRYATKTELNAKGEAIATNTANIAANKGNITKLENDKLDKALASETYATKDALNDLKTVVNGKADATDVNNKLANKADASELDGKANKADVYSKTDADTTFATKTELNAKADTTALEAKADRTYVDQKFTEAGTNVDNKLEDYYNKAEVDGKIKAEENARDTAITNAIGQERNDRDAAIKTAINGEVTERNQAIHTAITQEVTDRNAAVTTAKTELQSKITAEETERKETDTAFNTRLTTAEGKIGANETAIGDLKAADTALEGKITKNREDIATLNGKVATAEGNITDLKKKDTELEGRIKTNEGDIETNKNAISDINKRTAGIQRIDATKETTIEGNVTVNSLGNVTAEGDVTAKGKLTGDGVDAGAGAITTKGAVNAGSLNVTDASNLKGDVTMDKTLSVTGDTSLGALNVTGESSLKNTQVNGTLTTTGKATFKEAVDMDKGLTVTSGDTTLQNTDVKGALNVTGESNLKNTTVDGTLSVNKETTLNDKLTANGEATFGNDVTVKGTTNLKGTTVDGDLKVTGTITTDRMVFGDKATNNYTEIDKGHITSKNDALAGDATKKSSSMELDHSKLEVAVADKDSNGHLTMTADKTSIKNSDLAGKNYSEIVADKDSVKTTVKDEEDNTTSTKSSATEIRNYAKDAAGNKTNNVQTATQNKSWAKDKDGNESSIVQTGKDITNTAQNGTITNEAQNILNNATGDMTNTVGGKLTTTVTGQATEDFNGGLDTNVKGTENHTVTGNQNIHVTKNQTNKIDGDQENTIGGKQTTTVDGKVRENYKAGQETNVTGDQDIKVSGTQTTTATDINRNASSGMIDTVENASGSNKETKVAGQTTTDVKLASGEEGHYIRGATESRDYLLNGTLKNSETKTAEATSSEVTDGTNKASTIQDAKNLAGSVTNGTETGISGIHANNDGSVSIDSIVVGGGMSSVINQKKDSIQSAVGDGTNSTVIRQDKDNVAIASSNGTVAIAGKDIVNNASNSITDKVGDNTRVTTSTSITDTVGTANRKIENGKIIDTADDSTVTTENGKGTTFTKTGSTAYSTAAGAPTDTNIAGNHITTGRVDANELGVSDKDGANTADFSVEAGERKGVKASADNGTTTGSLDVTAEEVSSSVKDASGKGSTFKQRIDAIMMESKNVSITAEEKLTNEAKDIVTNASHSITEKVGDTNVTEKTTTSSKSEIQNADTITSVQQTESMVQSYVGKKDGSATNVTTNFANASANQVTENGQTSTVLNNKDGLLIRNTANGSSFTTADGTNTGRASEWTNVKGNEISTGKVEANYVKMDYADVMRDLGVRGNAKIAGKTTTGSLEVTGTSTLTGDVTMGSNATVEKNLNVKGTTTTKTLTVTENATVGGTLDVTQKATFHDDVDITKDLSVGGNATITGDVTANSYKVGDKTYISADGINANNQKITNVADGSISEGSKDAVNGGQLYQVKNDLEGKVNKVGANAAAMANLHPMEFDPDSKWNIAAAMGNYGSETATAIGAFYRPNEDVMVNFSTAFGTGENMVGGGVSVRLGKGSNKLSREESNALKAQVNDLTARMDALLSVLNPNMSKDFPDVPENHWAYEAVSRLAGNDIVQGYPDGEFHGERTMTRYEMAEIIYNALSRGAEAEKELVEEFKPELQAMAASEKATAERAGG